VTGNNLIAMGKSRLRSRINAAVAGRIYWLSLPTVILIDFIRHSSRQETKDIK